MPETFLILLAGGIMLAAAISDPAQVTLLWLRLCGILALCGLALSAFFCVYRAAGGGGTATWMYAVAAVAILGQIGFTQVARRREQRACATIAFLACAVVGVWFLRPPEPSFLGWSISVVSATGIAAMSGLVLMDMLLGHAYLTASNMTMAPFRRLNLALGLVILFGAVTSVVGPLLAQRIIHVEMLWGIFGLYMLTRWLVGLGVPAVFVYMTHDCIKRRATQSATGILYVAGVLVFIGEIIAVYLVRETGLPF